MVEDTAIGARRSVDQEMCTLSFKDQDRAVIALRLVACMRHLSERGGELTNRPSLAPEPQILEANRRNFIPVNLGTAGIVQVLPLVEQAIERFDPGVGALVVPRQLEEDEEPCFRFGNVHGAAH